MRAADQPEVGLLMVDRAAEQRLAAAAGDFARDVLLPQHRAVVGIERPDQPLLLRRDDDVAPVGRRGQRRRGREVPVGSGRVRTVLRPGTEMPPRAPRGRQPRGPAGPRHAASCGRRRPGSSADSRCARRPAAAPASTTGPCPVSMLDGHDRVGGLRRAGERVAGAEVERAALEIENRRHPDAGTRRPEHVFAARVLADDLRRFGEWCRSSRSARRSRRRAPTR